MFPIVQNRRNELLPAGLNGGLNGWFGKLIRKLALAAIALVKMVPIVGSVIQDELNKINEIVTKWDGSFNSSSAKSAADYEPTASEAAKLENWAKLKLNPYYKAMVTQLSNAFASSDIDYQLSQINNVMLKICVMKQYFAAFETNGLSVDAVKSRSELINRIMVPVESLITKSIADHPNKMVLQDYTFVINASNGVQFNSILEFVLMDEAYPCKKYVLTDAPNPNASQGSTPGGAIQPNTGTTTTKDNKTNLVIWAIGLVAAWQILK